MKCPECGVEMCDCCIERYGHEVCAFCKPSDDERSLAFEEKEKDA